MIPLYQGKQEQKPPLKLKMKNKKAEEIIKILVTWNNNRESITKKLIEDYKVKTTKI